MSITRISPDTFTYSLLNRVALKVSAWDLEPIEGIGSFNKHESIAHIELKMYRTNEQDFPRNKVIWNVPDLSVVHPNFKSEVETSLSFFVKHIAALRGKTIDLTFEVNDALLDVTAHRHNPFENATNYAILNCFGESVPTFRKETIENLKCSLDNYLKSLK